MKRRRVLQTILSAPAAAVPASAQAQDNSPGGSGEEFPKLVPVSPDAAARPLHRFFSPTQFAALEKLAEVILPSHQGRPSARESGACELIDFLVGESSPELQRLYRDGLDHLAARNFTQLEPPAMAQLLEPLQDAWSYQGPSQPFARFLLQVKLALFQAVVNSREFAEASSPGRRVSGGLTNYYWRSPD